MGPPSRIAAEDWPLFLPPRSEIVWRYLNEFKFRDLVTTSQLYLGRGDKYDDNDGMEGRDSPRK